MAPPQLKAKAFFGLRTDIQGNVHFITDSEIIYPAGGVLVLHDYIEKKQRFINLSKNSKSIKSIIISPNKEHIALSIIANKNHKKPSIIIYNLQNLKKEKFLSIPFDDVTCKEFAAMDFTCDSKYIVAITGEPDWMLYYYNWEDGKIESQTKAQNPSGNGKVTQVNCNPNDATLVVITGSHTFRIMNVLETVWKQWGWSKAENIIITSSIWITPSIVMFGTNNGALMIVENGELKESCSYKAIEIKEIIVKKDEKNETEAIQAKEYFHNLLVSGKSTEEIRCLSVFAKGFVYSCVNGLVHMFEKESRFKWVKRNIFKIEEELFKIGDEQICLNIIQHISVDLSQNTLLVTTLKSQLYFVKLFEEHMNQVSEISFQELGLKLHHCKINDLAMCFWKPIFMTSGEDDHSIRLWNYKTEELEFSKYYYENINSISLHPTGLFALIGFSYKLSYVTILIDDLYQIREFPIKNCKVCHFSKNGHMFAVVNGLIIQVYSTISFTNVINFKEHSATIKNFSWTDRDEKLFSCGVDGAVYEWCTHTGNRINEIVVKDNVFTDCTVSSDGKSVLVVGIDGEVKEIKNSQIIRNLKIIGVKLDNIVLARSGLMLFVTGGMGTVVSIQCPLLDKAVFEEFYMHNTNITRMALSYDDKILITIAEDGSICIWELVDNENRAIVMDKSYCHSYEILINKDELKEKNLNIMDLSKRIHEMEKENAYTLRKINSAHEENLCKINEDHSFTTEQLKEKIEFMESKHVHDIFVINEEKDKLKYDFENKIDNMEASFNGKQMNEYQKYELLEGKCEYVKQNYEKRIEKLLEEKTNEITIIKNNYESRLLECNKMIEELEEKNKLETNQHEYIKTMIEDDADREIVEIKTTYETKIKEQKDQEVLIKGEIEVFRKKIVTLQGKIETGKLQIENLNNEIDQHQHFTKKLENIVANLKNEICDRDLTIEKKGEELNKLRIKNQELEKYKFILEFKVDELISKIEPKNQELTIQSEKIIQLETQNHNLQLNYDESQFIIKTLKEKNNIFQGEIKQLSENNYDLKIFLNRSQDEIFNLSQVIQNPNKLKSAVKLLIQHTYKKGDDILDKKIPKSEELQEQCQQTYNLEKQIENISKQLKFVKFQSKRDLSKKIKENQTLLEHIEILKKELKEVKTNIIEMKKKLN